MKEILQQAKDELERAFSNPETFDLSPTIEMLHAAKEQYGDKGTMVKDIIASMIQANHARSQLEHAGDISSSAAFGETYNGLQQALKSYMDTDNDPL